MIKKKESVSYCENFITMSEEDFLKDTFSIKFKRNKKYKKYRLKNNIKKPIKSRIKV